jgi:hypothetical protein
MLILPMHKYRSLFFASIALAPLACSSSGNDAAPPSDSGPADGAMDVADAAPVDSKPPVTYPAFLPDMPQLQGKTTAVLKNPVVVTINWPSSTSIDRLEAFGDKLGATSYWKAAVAEYGVGPATSGPENHVQVFGEPIAKTMTTEEADAFVRNHVSDPAAKWPAPTPGTIYVVYLPPLTKLLFGTASSCDIGIGGYHSTTSTDDGKTIYYAIVPTCPRTVGSDGLTSTASHEIGEAATDPDPGGDGYNGFDNNHLAWDVWNDFNSENGDDCEQYLDTSFYTETEPGFDFSVQRMWSNASAAAGHDPCVPAPKDPYFNAVPVAQEAITVDLSSVGGSTRTKTKGYKIAVGETKTFEVQLFSDAPMKDWRVDVVQGGNPLFPGSGPGGSATGTIVGSSKGNNGDKITVSVTVDSPSPDKYELLCITSTNSDETIKHYYPFFIAN